MGHNNTNPIVKRIAVKAYCEFASPALIGSGSGENTDQDVLRDNNGAAFLPGSAIAGVLRSFASDTAALFGKRDPGPKGGQTADKISPLWVFDAALKDSEGNPAKIVELDGVRIDRETKLAMDAKKYDYEAIETGTRFTLRFLLTLREKDGEQVYETLLKQLIGALKSGGIAFGAKTRRGFGLARCTRAVQREFVLTPGNITALDAWLHFDWEMGKKTSEGWKPAEEEAFSGGMAAMTAQLKLMGSIMIRDVRNVYDDVSDDNKVPDYRHISSDGRPVILGTAWAGAFRSGLWRLLHQTYPDKAEKYLDDVFGYGYEPEERRKAVSTSSKVAFGVSFLQAADQRADGYRCMYRVTIDRFTGGAVNGALFMETPWYGGETALTVRYPKEREDIRELLLLGFDALHKGIIQIGGEAAVGRGFFRVIQISDQNGDLSAGGAKPALKTALESMDTAKAGETA